MCIILFIPLCGLLLLIEKSIELELSNPKCDGKECQRSEASGRRIDPEIWPHLTGTINSSIMMLSIAKVAGRTRGGQSTLHLLCQKLQRPFQRERTSFITCTFSLWGSSLSNSTRSCYRLNPSHSISKSKNVWKLIQAAWCTARRL